MNGALSGVRVLDFSEYIAGPYAGQMLADMGADVIKVEPPHGDFWRHTGPVAPFESRGFMGVNKGKRSVSLDLKQPAAREIVYRAIRSTDVFLANYRPGVAARLGIDYETLSGINPRLIYCENTAFGTRGPYRDKAGFDLIAQAMTGIMSFEGGTSGVPHPIITTSPTDLSAGMFMAYAIASALYQRERTGRGQHIETSLFAAGIAIQYRPMFSIEHLDAETRQATLEALHEGRKAGRRDEESAPPSSASDDFRRLNPYYKIYETLDSYIALACLNNRLRRLACEVLEIEDARVEGDEFNPFAVERSEAEELSHRITEIFTTRRTDEWVERFDARGVPCGPVRRSVELFDDPHIAAEDLIIEVDHPTMGKVRMANSPLRMSASETGARTASPTLGEYTRTFLAELGYRADEIQGLEEQGVIRTSTIAD